MLNSHSITQFQINQALSYLQPLNKEPEPIKAEPIKQTEPARRTIKSQATHSNQATLSPFNPKHKCTAIFKTHSQNLKTLQTKAQQPHEAPPHQLFKLSITPKPIFAPIRGNCESIPQETYSSCGNCK